MSTYAPDPSGLPPDLMAALSGGGAPPEAAPLPEDPAQQGAGDTTSSILERMIADAQTYLGVEQDQEDKLTMTKVLQQLQQYLAKEQSESDDLLSGKVSPRALRRATAGGVA